MATRRSNGRRDQALYLWGQAEPRGHERGPEQLTRTADEVTLSLRMHSRLHVANSLALALALSACSGAKPAVEPASAPGPQIAQPCSLPASEPASDVPLRVFVELATLKAPPSGGLLSEGTPQAATPAGSSFAAQLNNAHLTIPSVASVLATNDIATTIPWDPKPDNGGCACAQKERWDLSLKAHLEPAEPRYVTLELTLAPAPPLGTPAASWHVPAHRTVHTTVTVGDQQPVVLGGFAQHTSNDPVALVLTPTVIRSDSDLRGLFECKLKRAQAARRTAPSQ